MERIGLQIHACNDLPHLLQPLHMKISSSLQKCSFSLQAPLHCSNCRGSSLIRMSSLAARVGAAEAQVQASYGIQSAPWLAYRIS